MSGELYSDYMQREPHPRNAVFIKKWHGKLLSLALKDVDNTPRSVLEIGPGHGYFAEHCRQAGIAYEFCDTSPAVVSRMNEQGFTGHLRLIQDVANNLGKYDMIWMSHVLEHSPTWLAAREMVVTSKELLSEMDSWLLLVPMLSVGRKNSGMLIGRMVIQRQSETSVSCSMMLVCLELLHNTTATVLLIPLSE